MRTFSVFMIDIVFLIKLQYAQFKTALRYPFHWLAELFVNKLDAMSEADLLARVPWPTPPLAKPT